VFESCRKIFSEIPPRSKCEIVFLRIENAELKAKISNNALEYVKLLSFKDVKIDTLNHELTDLKAKSIADISILNAKVADNADVIEGLKAQLAVQTDHRAVDFVAEVVALDPSP